MRSKPLTDKQITNLVRLYRDVRNTLPADDRNVHGIEILLPRSATPELRQFFKALALRMRGLLQTAICYRDEVQRKRRAVPSIPPAGDKH